MSDASTIEVQRVDGDRVVYRDFAGIDRHEARRANGIAMAPGWYDVNLRDGLITRADRWPASPRDARP